MKVSARGRYAVKLMLDLAMYQNGEPVKGKDSARRQGIPVKFLEQIVAQLLGAGLIRSVRGANGGYLLSKSSEQCTMADILRVTEGSLSSAEPENGSDGTIGISAAALVWEKLDQAVLEALESITLARLKEWQQELDASQYVI